jgi:hypothetical protein
MGYVTYLDYFSELSKENLNKNDENLAVHNYDLPVISLRVPVTVVKKSKLRLSLNKMKLISLLVYKYPGHAWYS